MLDFTNLSHFLAVARHQNLARAADELHITPSAVSKSLRRLEAQLQTPLFDRDARSLKLNSDGRRLQERALGLLAEAEQIQAEFAGERQTFKCRVAGPSLLHYRWGRQLAERLLQRYAQAALVFEHRDDHAAVAAVLNGDCDVALIAYQAPPLLDARLSLQEVGSTDFRVCINHMHALAVGPKPWQASVYEVMRHDFVLPLTPPFAHLINQPATDGWRDDQFPRRVRYRTDDLLLVQDLLQRGVALAYLPDYLVSALDMQALMVTDCDYYCRQKVGLVYRSTLAYGWLQYVLAGFV